MATCFFVGSGIWYGKKSESAINIPDPQHWPRECFKKIREKYFNGHNLNMSKKVDVDMNVNVGI
jgi:hypothetical protein